MRQCLCRNSPPALRHLAHFLAPRLRLRRGPKHPCHTSIGAPRLWAESTCPCVWRRSLLFASGRLGAGGWDPSPSSRVTCLVHPCMESSSRSHRSVASQACASFFHHVPFPELVLQGEGCVGIIATSAPEGRPARRSLHLVGTPGDRPVCGTTFLWAQPPRPRATGSPGHRVRSSNT